MLPEENIYYVNRRVLGASFLVVGIFVIAYIGAYLFIQYQPWFRLSTSFQPTVIAFAVIIVIPLILAFLWNGIGIVRANIFGVEVEFDKIRLDEVNYEAKLNAIKYIRQSRTSDDALIKYIIAVIQEIRRIGTIKIIVVNLADGEVPWTMAHLYLLAALLEDFTEIQQIVFVTRGKDQKLSVIGFATPRSIRHAIARKFPALEEAYRRAYVESMNRDFIGQRNKDTLDARLGHILRRYLSYSNSNNPNDRDEFNNAWNTEITEDSFTPAGLGLELVNNSLEDPNGQILSDQLNRSHLQEIMNSTSKNIQSNPSSSTRFLAITHGEDLLIVDLLKLTVDVADGVLTAEKKLTKSSKNPSRSSR